MKMRVLDYQTLLMLNQTSTQAGRRQNLPSTKLPTYPQNRCWITYQNVQGPIGHQEVRLCVVLDVFSGNTAWLDVSNDEYAAIPEIDVPNEEWEAAMCAGTPPQAS